MNVVNGGVRPSSPTDDVLSHLRHGRSVDTLAERIRWVMDQKGWSARELARQAKLPSETHVGLILNPRAGSKQRTAADTLAKIAQAGGVNQVWLQSGKGPIAPAPRDELTNLPIRDFLRWYYATPAVKQCADEHVDVTVADLLRYHAEPARGGEADSVQVYAHIQQLRLGPIANTVGGDEPSASEFETALAREHDAAMGVDTMPSAIKTAKAGKSPRKKR